MSSNTKYTIQNIDTVIHTDASDVLYETLQKVLVRINPLNPELVIYSTDDAQEYDNYTIAELNNRLIFELNEAYDYYVFQQGITGFLPFAPSGICKRICKMAFKRVLLILDKY